MNTTDPIEWAEDATPDDDGPDVSLKNLPDGARSVPVMTFDARRGMLFYIVTLMAVTVLLIGMASCGSGGVSGPDATATYGAEQFHAQLTAVEAAAQQARP